MKLFTALLALASLSVAAVGQGPERLSKEELLKRFDKNKDGKLSVQEREAAKAALKATRGNRAGNQGNTNPTDVAKRLFSRLDKNSDGKVTSAEISETSKRLAARRAGAAKAKPGRGGKKPQRRGKAATNRQGNSRSQGPLPRPDSLMRFDRNGDKQLSLEEFTQAFMSMRNQRAAKAKGGEKGKRRQAPGAGQRGKKRRGANSKPRPG